MNTHVSEEQARLLPNKTAPEAPYEGSGYLLVLHVFHDLHCLDKIRQALYYFAHDQWNSTYNPYVLFSSPSDALSAYGGEAMRITHLDHCIDALRQSIQCHADIAPNVFQYSPKAGFIGARANVVHECRDFNKVSALLPEVTRWMLEAANIKPDCWMGRWTQVAFAIRGLWWWSRAWEMWMGWPCWLSGWMTEVSIKMAMLARRYLQHAKLYHKMFFKGHKIPIFTNVSNLGMLH